MIIASTWSTVDWNLNTQLFYLLTALFWILLWLSLSTCCAHTLVCSPQAQIFNQYFISAFESDLILISSSGLDLNQPVLDQTGHCIV